MKKFKQLIISILILLITINAFAEDFSIIHTTSIAGSHLKPFSGKHVTESNDCFSGVSYSNLSLPVGFVLIGAEIIAIDTINTGQLTIRIQKDYGPNRSNLLVGNIDLMPLEIEKYIAALQPYTINEDEFYSVFISSTSDTVKICGFKIYTVPASEIIFFNGFE